MRASRSTLHPLAIVCLLVLSLIGVVAAWNAAGSNPRDGWSWLRIKLGITPRSPSGDWAYHEVRTAHARVLVNPADPASTAHVMAYARRSRFGVFEPWLQTRDLRLLDLKGQTKDWHTGTANPQWVPLLRAVRAQHLAQLEATVDPESVAYLGRLIDAIDAELAGDFPERRILWRGLALDAAFIAAHIGMFVWPLIGVHRVLQLARADHRAIRRRCIHCGYDMRNLGAHTDTCPECGNPPAELRS